MELYELKELLLFYLVVVLKLVFHKLPLQFFFKEEDEKHMVFNILILLFFFMEVEELTQVNGQLILLFV